MKKKIYILMLICMASFSCEGDLIHDAYEAMRNAVDNRGGIPATPTGLTVGEATSSSIELTWDSAAEATGYRLYRADSADGAYARTGSDVTTGTAYTDADLAASTTYYYTMSAYNSHGESAKCTAVSGTTLNAILYSEIYDMPAGYNVCHLGIMPIDNDKILLIGGVLSTSTNKCYVYTISTNSFSGPYTMNSPRNQANISKLPDNRIFICGGYDSNVSSDDRYVNKYEIFNPANNQFVEYTTIGNQGAVVGVITASDGKTYLFGGTHDYAFGNPTNEARIYGDATTYTMNHARSFAIAIQYGTNEIQIIGCTTQTSTAEAFNMTNKTFTDFTPTGLNMRIYLRMIIYKLSDDKYLFIGYQSNPAIPYSQFYQPSTHTFTDTSHMPVYSHGEGPIDAYTQHTVSCLYKSRYIVMGQCYDTSQSKFVKKIEVYDINTDSYFTLDYTINSDSFHALCWGGDNKILIFGGSDSGTATGKMEILYLNF